MIKPVKIVSGAQAGADRAALDWAIENDIPHAGWCPKGRKAEDGIIPKRYALKATPSNDHAERTEWNSRDSDGAVIFSLSTTLTRGSKTTWNFARRNSGGPVLHISKEKSSVSPEDELVRFVRKLVLAVFAAIVLLFIYQSRVDPYF